MAINNIQLATNMTAELDKAIVQKSVTGFFNDNSLRAKFVGANTVSIPVTDMDGMGNYTRAIGGGYAQGGVDLEFKDYTIEMDRGRTFHIDAQDADETGIADLAGKVSGEFVRTKVVPEIDAYVLSKLGKHAETAGQTVTGTLDGDVLKMFNDAQIAIGSNLDFDQDLVCFVNPTVWAALMNTPAITRQITVSDFKQGELNLQVKKLNGVALIPVSDKRMYTDFEWLDGKTSGQEKGGFKTTETSKHIGMLMLPKSACMLVKKTDNVRVFDPMTTQTANAWKIDYRVYYDAFIKESEQTGVYAYLYN